MVASSNLLTALSLTPMERSSTSNSSSADLAASLFFLFSILGQLPQGFAYLENKLLNQLISPLHSLRHPLCCSVISNLLLRNLVEDLFEVLDPSSLSLPDIFVLTEHVPTNDSQKGRDLGYIQKQL